MTLTMQPVLQKLKLQDLRTIERLLISRSNFLQNVIGEPQATINTVAELNHTRAILEKIQDQILLF